MKAITGEGKREQSIDALSSHLTSIGVMVESREHTKGFRGILPTAQDGMMEGSICGSVKILHRTIDEILLSRGSTHEGVAYFRCIYLVNARVEGLEQKLTANLKLARKGILLRNIVDFRWEGQELAQMLNSDPLLRERGQELIKGQDSGLRLGSKLESLYKKEYLLMQFPGSVSITSYNNRKCVRIMPVRVAAPLENALPKIRDFEVFDRVAVLVRSIASC